MAVKSAITVTPGRSFFDEFLARSRKPDAGLTSGLGPQETCSLGWTV